MLKQTHWVLFKRILHSRVCKIWYLAVCLSLFQLFFSLLHSWPELCPLITGSLDLRGVTPGRWSRGKGTESGWHRLMLLPDTSWLVLSTPEDKATEIELHIKATSTSRAQLKLALNLPFTEFFLFFFMACNLPWRATIGKVNKRPHCFLVNIYHHHAILSSWNTAPTFQTNGLNCDRSSRCVSIPMLGQRVPPRCPRIPSCQFHEVPQGGTTLPAPWYP